MKNKFWFFQLPIIVLCVVAFGICDRGSKGLIQNRFVRTQIYPILHRFPMEIRDIKFRLRGTRKPKNNIVIVAVDNESIDRVGRWPWHRDVFASLVDRLAQLGAKAIGFDIVFSEADPRIPKELGQLLDPQLLADISPKIETDPVLMDAVLRNTDRVVLGWVGSEKCQPQLEAASDCPVQEAFKAHQSHQASFPGDFEKFSFPLITNGPWDLQKTVLYSVVSPLANLDDYNVVASHAGFFDATTDEDGTVRHSPLVVLADGKIYPSLALEMARTGLKEELQAKFDDANRLSELRFVHSGQTLPVAGYGLAEINFRGPRDSFPYISVADVLADNNQRGPSSEDKLALLRDAYVLIGVSAIGLYDMRSFPFDANVPGVEGHATLLDNILANDFLRSQAGPFSHHWIYLLMVLGGILFSFAMQRLEAIPAVLVCALTYLCFGLFDTKVLFANNINWDLSYLVLEFGLIFVFSISVKYALEERSKKFIRGAFSKYVAPVVVDSILKDPAKLSLGGEKRELTVLFSDIRSFTTFSEKLDAKTLAQFLNEYLSIMTEIVFANRGTLDKYIGDAIMAFWGAPLNQPDHAANAARAAQEMGAALLVHRERFKKTYGIDVSIGIGMNTGVVSVGNMGSNNNFAYTVIGDHVNLASRLEGLTKYYQAQILTTRSTFDSMKKATGKVCTHRVLDFVKVKGKQNAVEMIEILDPTVGDNVLATFAEARELYLQQKWDEAIRVFESVRELRGGSDGPSEMYIERIAELRANPPGTDWDGAWEMQSK